MTKYFHKIDLQQNQAANELSAPKWKTILSVFADIIPVSPAKAEIEGVEFGHVLSEEYFLFRSRYHPAIRKNMRVKFENRLYAIKRIVDKNSRRRNLDIYALMINDGEEK